MLQENDLIPYASSPLPPGPWLVFSPHPDDDVFGMGGSMALAALSSIRVEVVVMTGGDAAGDPDQRQRENLDAGAILGVSRYHFWGIPDRGIDQSFISYDELRSLLSSLQPSTLFLPGIQEYHPDHRATTSIIIPLLKSLGFRGKIWFYEISRQGEVNRLIDISSQVDRKSRAICCFKSQLSLVNYHSIVSALDHARSYTLGRETLAAEGFWEFTDNGLLALKNRLESYF